MLKKLLFTLYALIIVCIGFATVIEKYHGTAFVNDYVYGAWWFIVVWILLTLSAVVYMFRQRLYKRFAVMLLHVSFIVILLGALTTFLTAQRGTVHLRSDVPTNTYADNGNHVQSFPFSLTLKDFKIVNYPGTDAPLDYQSIIAVKQGEAVSDVIVSMNNIGNVDGYRLFQSSYDSDNAGVSLEVISSLSVKL